MLIIPIRVNIRCCQIIKNEIYSFSSGSVIIYLKILNDNFYY